MLPSARRDLNKHEEHEFNFRGMKHKEGARDGDIYDMLNISLDNYPSASVRKKRQKLPFDVEGAVYGVGSADKLYWCSGTDEVQFYYDGKAKFPVEASEKTFSVINKYVCIFPDKMYYSLWGDEAKNLKAGDSSATPHNDATEEGITLYESLERLNEAVEGSTEIKDGDVYAVGLTEPYSFFQYNSQGEWESDATTENHAVQTRWIYLMDSWGSLEESVIVISGEFDTSTSRSSYISGEFNFDGQTLPYIGFYYSDVNSGVGQNSKKNILPWIRIGDTVKIVRVTVSGEVETDYVAIKAKAYAKDFHVGSDYMIYAVEPAISLNETNYKQVTVSRVVPDLTYTFCHDNRLWGIDKDKICASKLGDPFNFQDYSTIADASWTVGVASSGSFTGGIAYNGYPTFFKEDRIIRVSGDYPAQYSTFETADIPGVLAGSGKSLAVADGVLYYLSPEGVCAYTGSYPTVIGDDIGEVLTNGYGGAGGDKYYLEAEILRSAQNDSWGRAVYVYDTKVRAWTKEDVLNTVGFTDIGRDIYALTEKGIYLLDSVKDEGEAEEDIDSVLEFAPIYDGHLKKKGVSRIHLSIKAEPGAEVRCLISYDGEGYKEVMKISPSVKRRNYNIPLTVRRCGFYQLKIMAKGGYTLYGLGRERYFGSEY